MLEARLLDCRPPRRDLSVTTASSHPELLCGELAMRPRIHVALTPGEPADVATWSRRMLGTCAIVALAFLALSLFQHNLEQDARAFAQARPSSSPCMGWDDAASEAIVRLMQSKRDVDLQQASHAVFQMRRARRNCEGGWVALACQDYQAIIRGSPAQASAAPTASALCPSSSAQHFAQDTTSMPSH
jgi:hypothetical protein